jgi:CRISPR-associated protein (Cas_Cmr3)
MTFAPVDVLSPKVGTPFGAGNRSDVVTPRPTTIARAVSQALGGPAHHVIGPLIVDATTNKRAPRLLIPVPADVTHAGQGRLSWSAAVLANDATVRGPHGKQEPATGFMFGSGALQYLSTKPFEKVQLVHPLVAGLRDVIALDGRMAVDGMLGEIGTIQFTDPSRYLFAAVIRTKLPVPGVEDEMVDLSHVALGGEGHRASVQIVRLDPQFWPSSPSSFPGGLVALTLVTPSLFADPAVPSLLGSAQLVGRTLTGPEPISTGVLGNWQLRWGVGVGSVFVFRFPSEPHALHWHQQCRPTSWGDITAPLFLKQFDDRLRSAGFGVALAGAVPEAAAHLQHLKETL